MKRTKLIWSGLALLLVLVVGAACQAIEPARYGRESNGGYRSIVTVDDQGNTAVDQPSMATALAPIAVGDLSQDEIDGLLWMREEEKLAHDVYVTLYAQWNLPVFQNISQSEQTHTDAVKTLLDRYGLDDPTVGNTVGVFTNATLQGLYDQLVAQGSGSLADALIVGATIEDLDIVDLQTQIALTDQSDIQLVYENLMKGSRNHLRSFTKQLETQAGQSYLPQYLDQSTYDAIVNGEIERGQGGGRGR